MTAGKPTVTFAGHATVRIELGGTSVLTDPVLKSRVAHLRRRSQPVSSGVTRDIDAVVVSHLHFDHLDLASLRSIPGKWDLIVPAGAGKLLRKAGFKTVIEMVEGESIAVGGMSITAVKAEHDGRRRPFGIRAQTLGYLFEADRSVYFAGDTDIFPGMSEIADGLDLALLPVWGWGHTLGAGHMDPDVAAKAAALLSPKLAVPIHWGTLFPIGMKRWQERYLVRPPLEFRDKTAISAPDTDVKILQPGESLAFD